MAGTARQPQCSAPARQPDVTRSGRKPCNREPQIPGDWSVAGALAAPPLGMHVPQSLPCARKSIGVAATFRSVQADAVSGRSIRAFGCSGLLASVAGSRGSDQPGLTARESLLTEHKTPAPRRSGSHTTEPLDECGCAKNSRASGRRLCCSARLWVQIGASVAQITASSAPTEVMSRRDPQGY